MIDYLPRHRTIGWLAAALARMPRWLGRLEDSDGHPLTVAEHSTWCVHTLRLARHLDRDSVRDETLMAVLLHDGHEAIIGDIPFDTKQDCATDRLRQRESHCDAEVAAMAAAAAGWDADWTSRVDDAAVHAIDMIAAHRESRLLSGPAARGIEEGCARRAIRALCGCHRAIAQLGPVLMVAPPGVTTPGQTRLLPRDQAAAKFLTTFSEISGKRVHTPHPIPSEGDRDDGFPTQLIRDVTGS